MLYNSWEYLAFLLVVLVFYYMLQTRWQNVLLLAASYFFYGWWDYRFLSLLLISTVTDYFCALKIENAQKQGAKRFYLTLSIVINLGLLGFFKYFNFFVDSAASLLSSIGFQPNEYTLKIILPVGISFYTFQTLSYTIDVYRKKMKPTKNMVDFALFVSFFTQLVAGPIERATRLLHQIENKRNVDFSKIRSGIFLIFLGLFKKIAIADGIAKVIDPCFTNPYSYLSGELWTGAYLFSIQIYCDFSGYSDMARGTGKLLGIDIMKNFNHPYLSKSVTEFWQRWHISLSTWLRDYLYIPMGGNRKGKLRTYLNLMTVMVLGGLWHGASWNFVLWGGLHGFYLSVHRFFTSLFSKEQSSEKPDQDTIVSKTVKILFIFHLVSLTWIFFRCPDLNTSLFYLLKLSSDYFIPNISLMNIAQFMFFALPVIIIDLSQERTNDEHSMLKWPFPIRALVYIYMFLMMLYMSPEKNVPFIYFQF